jgi:hypothetical protein
MTTDCGCCAAPGAGKGHPGNRSWLSRIDYRLGTFSSFRESLLAGMSVAPELLQLRSRSSDDQSVAAVDMWSAVADVITFYTERTANEAFIRTAVNRDSLLRLVRLIDYQLAPGAAASATLAFTLDPGSTAVIPARTRVQSVPAAGEKAQKYETLEPLAADSRLNSLRLFPAPVPATPTGGGTAAAAAPDDEAVAAAAALSPGGRVLLYAADGMEVLTVARTSTADGLLTVHWQRPIGSDKFSQAFDGSDAGTRMYRLGRSFRLFGHDAASTVVVAQQEDADPTKSYLASARTDFSLHGDGTGAKEISLDARYDGLKPGSTLLLVTNAGGETLTVPCVVDLAGDVKSARTAIVTSHDTPPKITAVEALTGTTSRVKLDRLDGGSGDPLEDLALADIRDIVVHELLGDPLRFWPFAYPDAVASRTVYLPGRRAGFSTIETGRTIEKGSYQPGTVIAASDLPAGRRVLTVDAEGGRPVPATILGAALTGSEVGFLPDPDDPVTLARLGLGPGQSTPLTAVVSAELGTEVALPGPRHELLVRIGDAPVQKIRLEPDGAGTAASAAAALQAALRGAAPGSPAFAGATVRLLGDASRQSIAVTPGIPGDEVEFGPTDDDARTLTVLGLGPRQLRFLDGVVSGPLEPLLDATVTGSFRFSFGVDEPVLANIDCRVSSLRALAEALMAAAHAASERRSISAWPTDDGRLLVLPDAPAREGLSWLRLSLEPATPMALSRASARLLGNVAAAGHGESIPGEIGADGDAGQAFQRFALRKKPVTYTPAAVPGGVASSLRVMVNGVAWQEVPSFHGAGPGDQVFITRRADDGTLSVQFGDGTAGARLPSGRQNVVAPYRQGIGLGGRVRAGTLTTLLDRPTGVKGATNPLPADGGADPETLERARTTAPGTLRTFGRAVSLRDFEDSALTAGEVAKARSAWVWTGHRRVVHVTVSGPNGTAFSPEALTRLRTTFGSERDPNRPLLIDNYLPVPIMMAGSILVDPRFDDDEVLAVARGALAEALSFRLRRFADPVYLSEVYAVLQGVAGVEAADIDMLDLKSTDPAFRSEHGVQAAQPQGRLLLHPARWSEDLKRVLPAELAYVETPSLDLKLTVKGRAVP